MAEGIKISEMQEKSELSGNEYIPIVDGAENKKTKVGSVLSDVYTKTEVDTKLKDYAVKSETDAKLTELENKISEGISVETDTSLNLESSNPIANSTVAKEFEKTNTKIESIEPVIINGDVTNNPDNETLAEVELSEGLKAIGIPNRQVGPNMGYVILKKNKSIIEQITDANTIYEIRYAYDLVGQTLNMPENCVLKFEGGIISNGTIIGNNTGIEASPVKIFEEISFSYKDESNVTHNSLFNIKKIPVEWFGAKSKWFDANNTATWIIEADDTNRLDDLTDSSDAINNALILSTFSGGKAYLSGKLYRIDKTVNVVADSTLYIGNDSAIAAIMNGTGVLEGESETRFALRYDEYFPTSSMAVAINLNGYSGRIEGHGQLLLQGSTYTIGILIEGRYYNNIDMTLHPYVDLRVVSGMRNQTCPEPTDIIGEGAPSSELEGTYYFDKKNKIIYKKTGDTWINWKNAWCFYNTSLRIDVTQTDSDYRIVNANINIWDIYGFRGIEIIQAGSSWCNDCFWHGSISNKCSNYVSIFGTNLAQHDMTAMNYQCGVENSENSMICYCEAHGIYLGRVWDLGPTNRGTYTRYVMSSTSHDNTAQWVNNFLYIEDYGTDNKVFAYQYDYDNPNNVSGEQYYNLYQGKSPCSSNSSLKFNKFLEFKENPSEYNINATSGEDFEIGMFNDDPQSFSTVIDTDNSLFASGFTLWYEKYQHKGIMTLSKHFVIYLEYEIDLLANENEDIYVRLYYGNKYERYHKLNTKSIKTGSTTRYIRCKDLIHVLFNGVSDYADIARCCIVFFTKSNRVSQKLNIFRIKVLLDGGSSNDETILSNQYGTLAQAPDSSIPGHVFFCTDLYSTLINKGNKESVSYNAITAPTIIEHETEEISINNLLPNVYHKWGTMDSLTISSFKSVSLNSMDEYMIEFTSGDTPTILTISGVKWIGGKSPVIESNKTYQISIVNKIAVIGGV